MQDKQALLDDAKREITGAISILRDALAGEVDIFTAAETAKQLNYRALVVINALRQE